MAAIPSTFTRVFSFIKQRIIRAWNAVRLGPEAVKGAAVAILVTGGLVYLAFILSTTRGPLVPGLIVGVAMVIMGALLALLGQGIAKALEIAAKLPWSLRWMVIAALALSAIGLMGLAENGLFATLGVLLVGSGLLGAGIAVLVRCGWRSLSLARRGMVSAMILAGALGLAGGLGWYGFWSGYAEKPVANAAQSGSPLAKVSLDNPALAGPYEVKTLTYGSGSDRYRPEYAAGAAIQTQPVDGSKLLEGSWTGTTGQLRTTYWGFGPDKLPLNGRVWYPQGQGPFPLIVAVHGNHLYSDFSDPGYAYLGELLASRGMIFVSVDQNFINTGVTDLFGGIQKESDARGWLLLEHLRAWLAWNRTTGSPFYGLVDTDNLAVMGHSRGGEAAAIAAAFNRLPYYPDNAGQVFDYNYNIRALMAIAPIDGQYAPTWRNTPLSNLNYFVLHGSHDADVTSFSGLRQYERIKFDPGTDWFKSALYVYRANHGQFNTVWGDNDLGRLVGGFLNRAALLDGEDQRQVARVYISAFFEAALKDQRGYLPLFQDARAAGAGWLPDTVTIHRLDQAGDRLIAGFDEDVDLRSTTLPGGMIAGSNLEKWREQRVNTKWGGGETNGVYLGWNDGDTAEYTVTLPDGEFAVDPADALIFNLADAGEDPAPAEKKDPGEAKPDQPDTRQPLDLTVELEDAAGQKATVPLSQYLPVQPRLAANLYKASLFQKSAPSESILQSYVLPLADFVQANPKFDPHSLRFIRFIFDRTPVGSVVLDGVGVRGE